jgi:hypothetical protein
MPCNGTTGRTRGAALARRRTAGVGRATLGRGGVPSDRELTSAFGVGEVQGWSAAAPGRAVQWHAWAAAVCVLAGYRAWGYDRPPRLQRSVGGGAPRWSLRPLWRGAQQALRQSPAVQPARATARGTGAAREAWLPQRAARGAAPLVAELPLRSNHKSHRPGRSQLKLGASSLLTDPYEEP